LIAGMVSFRGLPNECEVCDVRAMEVLGTATPAQCESEDMVGCQIGAAY
jgi:hypothetical protein